MIHSKTILTAVTCMLFGITGFAEENTKKSIQDIFETPDTNQRIEKVLNTFFKTSDTDPIKTLRQLQSINTIAKNKEDKLLDALSTSCLAYGYRGVGQNKKSLETALKGRTLAQESRNDKVLAISCNIVGVCYKDLKDYPRAKKYFNELIALCDADKCQEVKTWGLQNLSDVFLAENKVDSALKCAQKSFELSIYTNKKRMQGYTYISLGDIHGKLNHADLAKGYFNLAIKAGVEEKSPKQINWAYKAQAEYFQKLGAKDSAIYSAKSAIWAVENTSFAVYQREPAKILKDLYQNSNVDSAYKYAEIYHTANEQYFNTQVIQQTQFLTFEEETRAEESRMLELQLAEEQKKTIQYVLISIAIAVIIIVLMLLTKMAYTNPKFIKLFGVGTLLIVFEFFNLLFHSFLGELTHHSPILMLLGLASMAAVLVPMHHKLEKWTITKMATSELA